MTSAPCGTITVIPEIDPGAVGVSCTGLPNAVDPGERFTVGFEVSNGNDDRVRVDYEVAVGRDVADAGTATLRAGDSRRLDSVVEISSPGDYRVDVSASNVRRA